LAEERERLAMTLGQQEATLKEELARVQQQATDYAARQRELEDAFTAAREKAESAERLAADVKGREEALNRRGADVERAARDLAERTTALTEKQQWIETHLTTAEAREQKITAAETRLSDLDANLTKKEKDLLEREQAVTQLQDRLAKEKRVHDDVSRSLTEADRRIKKTEDELGVQRRRLEEEMAAMAGRRNDLDRQARELAAAKADLERSSRAALEAGEATEPHAAREAALAEREALVRTERDEVKEQAAHLRQRLDHLKKAWEEMKRKEQHLATLQASLDARQAELSQREASAPRPADTAGPAEITDATESDVQRRLGEQKRALMAMAAELQSREQALSAREARQNELASVVGNITDTFDRLQTHLGDIDELLQRKPQSGSTAEPASSRDATDSPRGPHAGPVNAAAEGPPADRPAMRSAIDILRRLGVEGSDEELEARLAQNPCEGHPPAAAGSVDVRS
jgi:chromosome segregation ATPase